jgi:hypothetical protein
VISLFMPHTALSRAADEPAFWWFELSEMMRKLLLTSVTAFLDATRKPYSELVCKIMISFIFFVVFTKYAPKSDDLLDVVMATAQLCTLLTLFYALLIKVDFFEAEGITPEVESSVLLSIQALPVLVSICCCAYAFCKDYGAKGVDTARRVSRAVSSRSLLSKATAKGEHGATIKRQRSRTGCAAGMPADRSSADQDLDGNDGKDLRI